MAATQYKLLFKGGIRAGRDEGSVKQLLGELLKLDAKGLAQLFSGRLITLKRGLSQADAIKYQQVLESIGAEILLQHDTESQLPTDGQETSAVAEPQPKNTAPHLQAAPDSAGADTSLACPRCGHEQPQNEQCCRCKMDLRRHIMRLERKAKAQQLRAAS
jgi:hypothetical protein